MFIRMVFSALTDADYLATEEHFDDRKADSRGGWRSIEGLLERFREEQAAFMADPSRRGGELNKIRRGWEISFRVIPVCPRISIGLYFQPKCSDESQRDQTTERSSQLDSRERSEPKR